jgi:hypothetical protein
VTGGFAWRAAPRLAQPPAMRCKAFGLWHEQVGVYARSRLECMREVGEKTDGGLGAAIGNWMGEGYGAVCLALPRKARDIFVGAGGAGEIICGEGR